MTGGEGGQRASVCMFVYNPFRNDSRVLRAAGALAAAGHEVRVVALRGDGLPETEERDGFRIVRLDNVTLLVRLARGLIAAARRRADGADPDGVPTRPSTPLPGSVGADRRARGVLESLRAAGNLAFVRIALPADLFKYWRRAHRVATKQPADVYYAHDLDTLPVAYLASRRSGAGLVYDSHELYVERSLSPRRTRVALGVWTWMEARLIRRASRVITVGDGIAEELSRRYGVPRPAVVRNVPALPPAAEPPDLRAKLDLLRELRIVLYLGGFAPNRGLEQLIEATARIPEIALVALGYGQPLYVSALRARAEGLGAAGRVRFAGPVQPEEVVTHAAGADIGACLIQDTGFSYYNSLPNKLFEYLAAGLPVVGSDFPGIGGLVRDHDVGVLCRPDDPEAVASAIRELLGDPERLDQRRANARAAARVLNWGTESRRLLEVFEDAGAGDGG